MFVVEVTPSELTEKLSLASLAPRQLLYLLKPPAHGEVGPLQIRQQRGHTGCDGAKGDTVLGL